MTMIERVAESQAKFDGRSLIGMPRGERERYLERARLAIAALREPTPEIEDAIRRTDCWDPEEHTESYGHAWRYAIDAALEEKP